ncbi:MAG: hypothetical protein H7Y32_12630 [Chloroflexales bacterium]|nr:hypothetical protein [Chloroflexales bacterium]
MARNVWRVAVGILLCGLLASCGQQPADKLPTAAIAWAAPPTATPVAQPTTPPAPEATPAPPTPEALAATLEPLEQYRRWMEEARAEHPYDEPIDHMWAVMLCESSGDAGVVSALYYGLFQYLPDTWAGEWNPYRDQPILDARAQIFATAKAWHDGNQSWWGCY